MYFLSILCEYVRSSPCRRYIELGGGADIVFSKSSSGEVLRYHTGTATCIAFAAGRGKKIVPGSLDREDRGRKGKFESAKVNT